MTYEVLREGVPTEVKTVKTPLETCEQTMVKDNSIAIVHNGIIENYAELKAFLMEQGIPFVSETDTEVVSNLLDKNYNGNLLETVKKTVDMQVQLMQD